MFKENNVDLSTFESQSMDEVLTNWESVYGDLFDDDTPMPE